MRQSPRSTASATLLLLAGFLGFATPSTQAQSVGSATGWDGYTPGLSWGSYSQPRASNGQPTRSIPPTAVAGSGWSGYAPATAWNGYRPGSSWNGYPPGGALTGVAVASTRPIGSARPARPVPAFTTSGYREAGTGRPIFMNKPWLPHQP